MLVDEQTIEQRQRRSKLYGMSEYLMVMQEFQKARLADRTRKAEAEPGERHGMIRHEERSPEIETRFGLEAQDEAGSEGATK
jgi:hypothetical protein